MHLTAEKKAQKEAILQAIESLKTRGSDVNPYSVAAESGVPRQFIVRNREIMETLENSRLESSGSTGNGWSAKTASTTTNGSDGEVHKLQAHIEQLEMKHEALNRELDQSHWDVQVLRKQIEDLELEKNKLRQNAEEFRDEAQNIAKSVNLAWQQGYLAGQHAATVENQQQKTFVETLAEAAKAATAYGAEENAEPPAVATPAPAPAVAETPTPADANSFTQNLFDELSYTPKPELTPISQHDPFQDSVAETETTLKPMESVTYFSGSSWDAPAEDEPYVADIELKFDDPEVLNDPFTAKLLGALHGTLDVELLEQEVEAAPELPENYIYSESYSEEPPEPIYDEASLGSTADRGTPSIGVPTGHAENHFVEQPDGFVAAAPATPPPLMTPPPIPQNIKALREEGETTQNFTADELHNLFRNKVLTGNEAPPPVAPPPEEKPKDPAISTTTKKFVGSKAQSSAEPLAAMQRSFPPEIRKACRLLGLNPEELSKQLVVESWKKEMSKPGVHPDTGGDTEMAIYLNTAKDALVRWCEDQAPKLGKKFGTQAGTRDHLKPQQHPKQD